MPVLTQAQKDSAKVASEATMSGGVHSAALAPFQEKGSIFGYFSGIVGMHLFTGILGNPFRSMRRFFFTLGILGFSYVALVAAGIVDELG
eukprot:10346020-Heterocapsa_arctica.AAC.1